MEFTTQISLFPITEKVNKAVERINMFADCSKDIPIWLATSKGKDSLILEYVFSLSNAKYEKHFSLTSVDPPELVSFAKKDKDLIIDKPRWEDGTHKTMWNLIPKKKMPPTRLVRYCCTELKECFGVGRITATGVRYAESTNRKNNQGEINIHDGGKSFKAELEKNMVDYKVNKSGGILLNLDNSENRRMVEQCYRTRKTLLNPIIDFTDKEVWDIIHSEKIPYCELYDCGFKRLGCIGCPMARNPKEFERYPKYKEHYISAFQRMIDNYKNEPCSWKNGEDCFNWWIGNKENTNLVHEDQLSWFDDFN